MRRLVVLIALGLTACTGDDGSQGSAPVPTEAPGPPITTDTLPPEVADAFDAVDVEALCADLRGLAAIDPDLTPTQAQVDRLRAIAGTAPSGVAEPLRTVAEAGQALVDGEATPEELDEDAAGAALLLVAYGNDACGGITVPLFNQLSGYG